MKALFLWPDRTHLFRDVAAEPDGQPTHFGSHAQIELDFARPENS